MSAAKGYLLDTNIVLHLTRAGSHIATTLEAQFEFTPSPFRPAICEVTIAELSAFALSASWGESRKNLLAQTIGNLLVIPIGDPRIHQRWAELRSEARARGVPLQHDHNDIWIAATSHIAGLKLLTMDAKAFLPFRGTEWVDVEVIDAQTGLVVP